MRYSDKINRRFSVADLTIIPIVLTIVSTADFIRAGLTAWKDEAYMSRSSTFLHMDIRRIGPELEG